MSSPVVNCDIGEAYGMWALGDDEAVMPFIELANVACGFHAGDPVVMRETVASAKRNGVAVGAHPSYPDLQGFGRREMSMDPDELSAAITYQVGALQGFLIAEGMTLNHIKPHGALYGAAAQDAEVTGAVADACLPFGVPLLGMADTEHERVYRDRGLDFLAEFYADLDYDDEGGLLITRKHDELDLDVVRERVIRALRDGVAESSTGAEIPMRADCVCIHSDTPNVAELARVVRAAVDEVAGTTSEGSG